MRKLSTRQVLTLSKLSKRHSSHKQLIDAMKNRVKKDPVVIKKFKEYGVSIDKIDDVPVSFCELDVSAKTKDKKIYLNISMLDKDSEVKDPATYLVHELTHFLQQLTGNISGHRLVSDYMDKPTEQEAFKAQIDFKKENEGEEEAEKYTDELLDYHNLHGKEREEKKKKLVGK